MGVVRAVNKKVQEESLFIRRGFRVEDFRAAEPTAEKKTRRIEGHPAVYDSTINVGGWFEEVIERGAFDGCDFTDVLLCVNHNLDGIPLARSRRNNGNSTMLISTDSAGLYMSAELDVENNIESRQLCSSVDRGDMDGMSFYFRVAEQTWERLDTDLPLRRITKIAKVFEVSAVNWPAYEETDIDARGKSALDNAKKALDSARAKELDSSSNKAEIYKIRNKILGGM